MTSSNLTNRFLAVAKHESAEADWHWAPEQIQQAGRFALAGEVTRLSLGDIGDDKLPRPAVFTVSSKL
jgi:hypothetical protein